jgi:hypothetical protein
MKNYALKILIIFLILIIIICRPLSKKLSLFGVLPIFDPSKKIVLVDHVGKFTNEFGRETSFQIYLSEKPFDIVKIGPITSSDTTEGVVVGDTYLEFTDSNYNEPRTITIKGIDDSLADGNKEYKINFGSIQTTDYSYSLFVIPEVSIINTDRETAGIASSPLLGLATNEGGNTVEFNVVLSTQPGADVVIPAFSSSDTAECIVNKTLTFTSSNWDIPQKVQVTGVDDLYVDGAKNCLISSTNSTSIDKVYENKTIPIVTIVNVDDDIPGFTFIPLTTAETTESGGQAQFSVVMNTKPYGNIQIPSIQTSDSTEASISPTSVTFTTMNWDIPQVLVVSGADDSMMDGDINFTIVFGNATIIDLLDVAYHNFSLPSAGSFTNKDNDTRGIVVEALAPTSSINPLTVTEGGTAQTFRVRITSVPCDTPSTPQNCSPTDVTMSFQNTIPSEYSVTPSSLTFTPGNWNVFQTVTVSAIDDYIDDDNTNTTLLGETIIGTTDYTGMKPIDIPIIVVDNDTAGYDVNPTIGVSVDENDPGGTGLETIVYISLTSEPTSTVTISPILSSDTLEVIVAPTLGGGNNSINNRTLTFTPTMDQVIVNSDANSDGFNDTTTGGWNVPQAVRLRAVVDGTLDGDKLSTISFGARTTTDMKYLNPLITPLNSFPVTNRDSGDPEIILQNISALSFAENDTATITFQIRLKTLPIGNVTISNIVSLDTTEGVVLPNGGGAPITNRTLVFTPSTNTAPTGTNTTTGGWNMPQTVTIRSVADSFDDGDIPFKIKIPTATGSADYSGKFPVLTSPAYNSANGELTLTNIDDDTKGITYSSTGVISITEGGTNETFTVRLNSNPCTTPSNLSTCESDSVTINFTNNNPTQYTVSPSSITFAPDTWNSPIEVTIIPFNDDIDENDIDYTLVVNSITGSSDYNGFKPPDRTIRVVDNDTAGIGITVKSGYSSITSSVGGISEYELKLNSSPAPGNTVSVTLSVPLTAPQEGKILDSDGTTLLNSRVFTFDSTDWNDIQNFKVIGQTGSGTGSTVYSLSANATEGPTVPPAGYSAGQYNSYSGKTVTQSIRNYHIGAGKKIRLAGNIFSINESNVVDSIFFNVLLNQEPQNDVVLQFGIDPTFPCTLPASVGSTPQFNIITPTITITKANWNELTNTNRVEIKSNNDSVDDGNVACVLRITSTSSADLNFDNLSDPNLFELPTITVNDNETYGYTISSVSPIVNSRLAVSKSGTSGSFNIRLRSRPMTDVTLSFSDTNNRINYPSDLTFTPSNWNTPQAVNISGKNNGPNADEDISILIQANASEVSTGAPNANIYNTYSSTQNALKIFLLYDLVKCTSTDIASCATQSPTGGIVPALYTTSENATEQYFAIKLRAKPNSNVTIPISSSNTNEGVVSTGSLVFTPANFGTFQVVTVTGVDDLAIDGSVLYNIVFEQMTGDANFSDTIPTISITNQDND